MKSLITVLMFISTTAFAQGSSGSGGNDLTPDGALDAWFTGNRTIHYCIEISPQFGTSLSFAEKQIELAFETWRAYMDRKGVNNRRYPKPPAVIIANRSAKIDHCDGSEDLRFLLGIENESVLNEKKKYFNPDAFAKRESYDKESGWGKGFIWIANAGSITHAYHETEKYPIWNSTNRLLQALLTHELGHVFGNGHVKGTIMAEQLSADQDIYDVEIDGAFELFEDKTSVYQGGVSAEVFRFFTGRDPQGNPSVEFGGPSFLLKFKDHNVSYSIEIQGQENELFSEISNQVFGASSSQGREHSYCNTAAITFTTKTSQGKVVVLTVAYNMTSTSGYVTRPLQIYYFDQGVRKDLFIWKQ